MATGARASQSRRGGAPAPRLSPQPCAFRGDCKASAAGPARQAGDNYCPYPSRRLAHEICARSASGLRSSLIVSECRRGRRNQTQRQSAALPPARRAADQAKLIGVFGFFGRYKGFETVIRALHHIPPDHHLLIFGGVHPNEIKAHQPIDPTVAALFEAGFVDTNVAERIRAIPAPGTPTVSVAVDGSTRDLLIEHPKDLSRRIHFLGATSDEDFLAGMAICDTVVFPYLEVGQSASGPISQALELGCRVIASRTHTFLQFAKYHQDMIEYFDIGNHLELAARLVARPQYEQHVRSLYYNVETNQAIYAKANGLRTKHDRYRERSSA